MSSGLRCTKRKHAVTRNLEVNRKQYLKLADQFQLTLIRERGYVTDITFEQDRS